MAAKMTEEQAQEFIRKGYEDDGKDFHEITRDLAKAGYVSEKTGRPLPWGTVRYRYYHRKGAAPKKDQEALSQLSMIRAMLKLNIDDEVKVKLVNQVLDKT